MTTTILLSRVLGIFLIVVGAIIVLRRNDYAGIFAGFVRERLLRVFIGMLELLAGIFLLVQHQDWSSAPAAIITLLGWVMVIEAALYLSLSDALLERMLQAVNRPPVYVIGGVLAIALGMYLGGYGFGYLGA